MNPLARRTVVAVAYVVAVSCCSAQTAERPVGEHQAQAPPGEADVQKPEAPKATEETKSTLDVKPGKTPAIKTPELILNKPISPWEHFPRRLLSDQKTIWTSPFRTKLKNVKYWAIFGGATGILLATDTWTSRQLPNTADQVRVARITSQIGAWYTLAPATAATYFIGTFADKPRLRETGMIATETLVNTFIVVTTLKSATQRERPTEGTGDGRFYRSSGRAWNAGASFPSGHAMHTWALASVIAHEYPRPRIIPILSYVHASTVVASRFAAQKHFASDVVAGAAIGWFIGDFVYGKRHNRELDGLPRSKMQKILSHVQLAE